MNEADKILVINAGSSSIKFAVFDQKLERHLGGELEGLGQAAPKLKYAIGDTNAQIIESWSDPRTNDVTGLTRRLIGWIETQLDRGRVAAIGHRVAIGGLEHSAPAMVTSGLLAKLRTLVPLAPLHQPRNLEPIAVLHASHPDTPQVACFDTAFHRTLPRVAQLYALPRHLMDAGAHRYGFHGLSYEYISEQLPRLDAKAASGRTIVCHLGSGASLCAMQAGKSIATTMGFSPLSGLVMGTRPGDLDPGLMIWLIRERGMSVDEIEQMLYHECGLKGVSGSSSDMRDLLASPDLRAKEAVELFTYKVATEIGRLVAALGGLDSLVFTAGIGEHAPEIRHAICEQCGWLGLRLDDDNNAANAQKISAHDSTLPVWVVPTDEERMVALHTIRLMLAEATAKT